MAASPLKQYLDRSFGVLRKNTVKVMKMDITPRPPPLSIFNFSAEGTAPTDDLRGFATGSDADIGGLSTCALTPVAGPSRFGGSPLGDEAGGQSHLAFHGNLSLDVPPAYTGKIRTGYAAFRNKTRPTLFGEETWDLSLYSHLRVVLGYRGWDRWRDRWVVNIQTDGPVRSDLFQHRLSLPSPSSPTGPEQLDPSSAPPPGLHTLHLPLASFVLTNSGQTASTQIPMLRSRIRTIGFALLGAGRSDDSIPSTLVNDEMRRLGAGGWRTGKGDVEVDRELEELIQSDSPGYRSELSDTSELSGGAAGGGGYHRVGTAPVIVDEAPRPEALEAESEGLSGYYELCVRSVEAVRWDPETEELD